MADEQDIHNMDGETSASDLLVGRAERTERERMGKWGQLFNNLAKPLTAPYRGLKYWWNNPLKGTFTVAAVIGGGVGIAVAKAHYIDDIPLESLDKENLVHLALNFGPTFAIATGAGGFLGYMTGRISNTIFNENFQHYSMTKAGRYIGAFLACWAAFYGHDHGKDYTEFYKDVTINAPDTAVDIANAQHDFWFPEWVNTKTDPKWEVADQPTCLYYELLNPERENKCIVKPEGEGIQITVPGLNAPSL